MNKSRISASLAIILAPYIVAVSAIAFDPPKQAYKAVYDMPSAKEAKAQMIIAWNGKDIGVTHAVRNGEKLRIVSDFKNHRAILFMDAHKIASPVPLSAEFTEIYDVQTYKNKATKTLGSKTINGQKCHGYIFVDHATTREVWIGDDCKVLVVSKYPGAEKNNLTLKSFDKSPADSEFNATIPADYETYIPKSTKTNEKTPNK